MTRVMFDAPKPDDDKVWLDYLKCHALSDWDDARELFDF